MKTLPCLKRFDLFAMGFKVRSTIRLGPSRVVTLWFVALDICFTGG